MTTKSIGRQNFQSFDLVLFALVFVLLAFFSIHSLNSIGQDIGRHLKLGEIIWQTKSVPKTNLFSFTEPNFAFINHHWLSEVIFYKVFSWFGFTGLIWLKVISILVTFGILFRITQRMAISAWGRLISFLLSLFIFISRTDVRPEIFSFVILALFLWVLFREKYKHQEAGAGKKSAIHLLENSRATSRGSRVGCMADFFSRNYLWLLPIAEVLWVNMHIYFFIGPFLLVAFLIDRLINKSAIHRSKIFLIFLLTSAATLLNPNGLQGALAPFNILKHYGYMIVENQSLSFLAPFLGFDWSIFIFKISATVLAATFLLMVRKIKKISFEVIISLFFIYAGFTMLRNLPLYALASFPILSLALTEIFSNRKANLGLSNLLKVFFLVLIVLMIPWVATNGYYKAVHSSETFGFSVPGGLEEAVRFVKENKIKGPVFNNFDIGGYLIWRLYPEQKVFVDNRPEAYSVKFFNEIYKPMQEDPAKWAEFSEKYGINYIFFSPNDATPWGQTFLQRITKDPAWQTVFFNNSAIILVKK